MAHAATNDLTALLQRGLFEEEANRNLDAAIASYDALAKQFDKNRQIAATAIFRLGECYRKLGRTNDAIRHYERIVRDFSDQQMLVTLSRQNLAGMGKAIQTEPVPAQGSAWTRAAEEASAEAAILKVQVDTLRALPKNELRNAIRQFHPSERLTRLLDALADAVQKQRQDAVIYNSNHPQFKTAVANIETIHREIEEETEAILQGLELKHKIAVERAKVLQSQSGAAAPRANESQPVLDDEEKEIRRLQAMIQNSPDLINAGGMSGTPLGKATSAGWLRAVRFLIEQGADVNLKSGGAPPVVLAARSGNRGMTELLLERGADVNATDGSGRSALHTVAMNGFRSVAEVLVLQNADINARDDKSNGQNTPLHLAAGAGHIEMVRFLVAQGSDVNARNANEETPLIVAVRNRGRTVAALLEAKADPNLIDRRGRTALSYAAQLEDVATIKLLLDAKANPDAGIWNRPLFGAISHSDTNIAELLLRAGADPNLPGQIDSDLFRNRGNVVYTNLPLEFSLWHNAPLQAEVVKTLLQFKADPNRITPAGEPVIFQSLCYAANLRSLLEAGANPNVVSLNRGETPLLVAVRQKFNWAADGNTSISGVPDMECVKLLIEHRAKVNVSRERDGWTPLHVAAGIRNKELVELLLRNGAETNVRNTENRTPLDLTKSSSPGRSESPEIAQILRAHGALDDLPDFSSIRVTRQGMSRPQVVFQSDPGFSNRFTLLETLLRFYWTQRNYPYGVRLNDGSPSVDPERLVFPDLKRIIVHRPARTGKSEQTIAVNLLNATNGIDCSRDIPLEFGDVVEVPVREYGLREPSVGLTTAQWSSAAECLEGEAQVTVRNENRAVKLNPYDAYLRSTLQTPEVLSLLLSSSDLSRVKVTRRDAGSGKTQEWIVDCDPGRQGDVTPFGRSDLWLRNGDTIEIPER